MSAVIEIKNLTKDYGEGRGIFGIHLSIAEGEMVGFAGTNGSGKTTTIRHIMGFLQPTDGAVYVNGLEAWKHSSEYIRSIGYVPGEIAFPDLKTGTAFLRSQADFLGVSDMSYANRLIEKLQLDPSASLKRMSKGMKQKTAIVAALMADPAIIVLDEPTTGLDPLLLQDLPHLADCGILGYVGGKPQVRLPILSPDEYGALEEIRLRHTQRWADFFTPVLSDALPGLKLELPAHLEGRVPAFRCYSCYSIPMGSSSAPPKRARLRPTAPYRRWCWYSRTTTPARGRNRSLE